VSPHLGWLEASVIGGSAYVSIRFLSRHFENRPLKPFAGCCVVGGAVSVVLVNR
jgi:hypothetical protein